MKLALAMLLCLPLLIVGQEAKGEERSGSIILIACKNCADLVSQPTPKYPAYVGFGPHVWQGTVGIQVRVKSDGTVSSAKAIFGNPYFRPLLERESLTAKFRSGANSSNIRAWILVYEVKPPSSAEPVLDPSASRQLGIVNGQAIRLPKPKYPLQARKYCAEGKVEVEVTFNRTGRVILAKATSGNAQLRQAAVAAARHARFRTMHGQPDLSKGVLVYQFISPWKCIQVGVINERAISIPKPSIHPNHLHNIEDEAVVDVQIVVEPGGNVVSARALSGHPLIKVALETSAQGVKFTPVNVSAYVRGVIRYVVKRDGCREVLGRF